MKVIVHIKPIFDEEWSKNHKLRSLNYSIKKKNEPWWTNYSIDYFIKLGRVTKKSRDFLNFVIDEIYEATHDVPNCEDCELVEEPVNYRQMEMEDRD